MHPWGCERVWVMYIQYHVQLRQIVAALVVSKAEGPQPLTPPRSQVRDLLESAESAGDLPVSWGWRPLRTCYSASG